MTAFAAIAALLMSGAQSPQAATPSVSAPSADTLASETLAKGETTKAIAALERQAEQEPHDPAILINLGIAHAQTGSAQVARSMFERALVSPEPTELELADGQTVDSRRLARKAIRMLERGERRTGREHPARE